ncbi:hypothetical protein BLNAU_18063 [Blattamonas nauphoetae]|uniref:C2 DOCK-type domain-containing protein n=1 Tax=Blattamonas nauphoetae TaxID=2049346 RepID=A0ABQ9X7J2_9EUKA|nr:hypothetical protein BLNAU_18063 [Blattamonas nauphoetae]
MSDGRDGEVIYPKGVFFQEFFLDTESADDNVFTADTVSFSLPDSITVTPSSKRFDVDPNGVDTVASVPTGCPAAIQTSLSFISAQHFSTTSEVEVAQEDLKVSHQPHLLSAVDSSDQIPSESELQYIDEFLSSFPQEMSKYLSGYFQDRTSTLSGPNNLLSPSIPLGAINKHVQNLSGIFPIPPRPPRQIYLVLKCMKTLTPTTGGGYNKYNMDIKEINEYHQNYKTSVSLDKKITSRVKSFADTWQFFGYWATDIYSFDNSEWNPLDQRSSSTSGRERRASTISPGTDSRLDGGTLSQVGTPAPSFDSRDEEQDRYQTETRFCPQGKELFEEEFTFQIQNLRKMDDKLDEDSFIDQLKSLNLKPIEKSRPDTQSAFDESRRDVVKFNMTIKATYHQNYVFHNAILSDNTEIAGTSSSEFQKRNDLTTPTKLKLNTTPSGTPPLLTPAPQSVPSVPNRPPPTKPSRPPPIAADSLTISTHPLNTPSKSPSGGHDPSKTNFSTAPILPTSNSQNTVVAHYQSDTHRVLTPFLHSPLSPSLSATHILFLYPQSIDFTSLKTDLSMRNILIETEIRDTDNLSSPGLPLIFNNKGIGSNEMMTVHKSCVRYHEQRPTFGDEIKVKLPLSYFPSEAHCNPNTLHALFKFYHLECKNVKDGEPGTLQLIGHCVYPLNLFSSHTDLSQKFPTLSFQEGLEHGYLSHPQTKWLADEQAKGHNVERDENGTEQQIADPSLSPLFITNHSSHKEKGVTFNLRVRFISSLLPDDQRLLRVLGLRQIDLSQSWLTTLNGAYFAPDAIWKEEKTSSKSLTLSTLANLISIIPSAKPTPQLHINPWIATLSLFPNTEAHEMVRFFPAVADTLLYGMCSDSHSLRTLCFSRFVSTVERVFHIEVTELSNTVGPVQVDPSLQTASSPSFTNNSELAPILRQYIDHFFTNPIMSGGRPAAVHSHIAILWANYLDSIRSADYSKTSHAMLQSEVRINHLLFSWFFTSLIHKSLLLHLRALDTPSTSPQLAVPPPEEGKDPKSSASLLSLVSSHNHSLIPNVLYESLRCLLQESTFFVPFLLNSQIVGYENHLIAFYRSIALLLCNIASLAAQRQSASDKSKQAQSNLSFLPATLPRKDRHAIAELFCQLLDVTAPNPVALKATWALRLNVYTLLVSHDSFLMLVLCDEKEEELMAKNEWEKRRAASKQKDDKAKPKSDAPTKLDKWKPHKSLQLVQRMLLDLWECEMLKFGFSSIPPSSLRYVEAAQPSSLLQSIRLSMPVVTPAATGLRSSAGSGPVPTSPKGVRTVPKEEQKEEPKQEPVSEVKEATETSTPDPTTPFASPFASKTASDPFAPKAASNPFAAGAGKQGTPPTSTADMRRTSVMSGQTHVVNGVVKVVPPPPPRAKTQATDTPKTGEKKEEKTEEKKDVKPEEKKEEKPEPLKEEKPAVKKEEPKPQSTPIQTRSASRTPQPSPLSTPQPDKEVSPSSLDDEKKEKDEMSTILPRDVVALLTDLHPFAVFRILLQKLDLATLLHPHFSSNPDQPISPNRLHPALDKSFRAYQTIASHFILFFHLALTNLSFIKRMRLAYVADFIDCLLSAGWILKNLPQTDLHHYLVDQIATELEKDRDADEGQSIRNAMSFVKQLKFLTNPDFIDNNLALFSTDSVKPVSYYDSNQFFSALEKGSIPFGQLVKKEQTKPTSLFFISQSSDRNSLYSTKLNPAHATKATPDFAKVKEKSRTQRLGSTTVRSERTSPAFEHPSVMSLFETSTPTLNTQTIPASSHQFSSSSQLKEQPQLSSKNPPNSRQMAICHILEHLAFRVVHDCSVIWTHHRNKKVTAMAGCGKVDLADLDVNLPFTVLYDFFFQKTKVVNNVSSFVLPVLFSSPSGAIAPISTSTDGKNHEQSQDKTLNSIWKTLIRNLRTVLFQEDVALLNSTLLFYTVHTRHHLFLEMNGTCQAFVMAILSVVASKSAESLKGEMLVMIEGLLRANTLTQLEENGLSGEADMNTVLFSRVRMNLTVGLSEMEDVVKNSCDLFLAFVKELKKFLKSLKNSVRSQSPGDWKVKGFEVWTEKGQEMAIEHHTSPFYEVAHNFAGQMTKLLKRLEAINNLPAESQFQRARYLSNMISEYDLNPLLQVMCYKRLRKHWEKTSHLDTAATVQLRSSMVIFEIVTEMIRRGFLDKPINTREWTNLLNDCTTCGWKQLVLDIIPTATFLTKERLADIFTRDVISVIISAKSKPGVPLFSLPSLISSLILSATLFSHGPYYELSTRVYQLVLRLCASINDTRTMSTVYAALSSTTENTLSVYGPDRVRNQYWLVGLHGKGFRQLDKKEYVWKTVEFEALDRMMKLLRAEYANLVAIANKERPEDDQIAIKFKQGCFVESGRLNHAYITRRKEIQKSLPSKSQPTKEDESFHQPPLTVFPENEMTIHLQQVIPQTQMEPFLVDCDPSLSKLSVFVFSYSQSFTLKGKSHGNLEEEYLIQRVIRTKDSQPGGLVAVEVDVAETETIEYNPCQRGVFDIEKTMAEMADSLKLLPKTSSVLRQLKGVLATEVNLGMEGILNLFLLDMPDLSTPVDKQLLRDSFKALLLLCRHALTSIAAHIEQRYYTSFSEAYNRYCIKWKDEIGDLPLLGKI